MSKEVTEIINTLCDKLGVAASILVPELAKKNIAQDVVGVILCGIVLVVAIIFIIRIIKLSIEEDDDFDFDIACTSLLPAAVGIIAFIIFGATLIDLAGWLASPTAMAIEQITNMIK